MNNIVTQRFIKCHDKLREDNRIRSSRQFAMALDYLPQSLSEILKGRRDVTVELLRKAIEKYKINPVYLYMGEGPMFMSEETQQDVRVLTVISNAQQDDMIVHVPAAAQAGYALENSNPGFVQSLPMFSLPEFRYKGAIHRSFEMVNDSMMPLLHEGDKVICSFLEPALWESSLRDNNVYVIVSRSDVVIKRVVNLLRDRKQLRLLSDHAGYDPYTLNLSDIREIWTVRSRISHFLPLAVHSRNGEELHDLRRLLLEQSQLIQEMRQTIEKLWNDKE